MALFLQKERYPHDRVTSKNTSCISDGNSVVVRAQIIILARPGEANFASDCIRHPETYIHRYSPERYIPEPNPLYIYCLQPYPVALLLITELLTTKSCVSTNIVSAFSVLSPQVVEYGSAASRTLRGTATRQRRVQFQAPLDSGASTVAGTRSFAVARAGKKTRELKGKVRFTLTYHLVKGSVAKIYRYIPSMN